ncbi:uncharacterized protein HMPREF1541_03537 [Cyphellophora europaea CBS 101466]|uniref:DSBA-like thioredoxin domain-containing protein n=1 Tax=Cyphellophora europaea (strain CBS 101466) TaxID=1220924 RepID=W2RYM0_CYPE1|nr:uncharacterized protein HMPREF1541_03537 [Cyphellophora europaea CBS 101466]ETN41601.1 hypothetical protein HMPREF1541_03537 [Cyphellophora europaea CBS 101466]
MAPTLHLDFHYDISCPFAYIASLRLPFLQRRHPDLVIAYRPVLLGALYRATSAPQGAAGSASDTFNPTKRNVTSAAFARTLRRLGVPHRQPPKHPLKTTRALRLLYCVQGSERVALTAGLYRAYWVEGQDVGDVEVLQDVVKRCEGLSAGTKGAVTGLLETGDFEGTEQRRELQDTTDLALQRGAFGVPALWVLEEKRLYWGQDRMHFVDKALYALEKQGSESLALEAFMPRSVPVTKRAVPDGEEVKLEFWYDFSSPWAFLGWTQLARVQRACGPRLKIVMKPFLLGILFREIGAPNLPMATVSEAKRKYQQLDHNDWCQWWNDINRQNGLPDKEISFHWADIFPIRTPAVLRAVLVEPKLVDVLFRGCWERNLDMASDKVLHSVIAEAGYDADSVLACANSAEVKQKLRDLTKEAKNIGLCGVPSYRVFRRTIGDDEQSWKLSSDTIWGQDEIAVVEDLISGWDGKSRAFEAGAQEESRRGNAKL